MKNQNFQLEVIQGLTEIKTKQNEDSKKITQLFDFHNSNQKNIDLVPEIKKKIEDHEDGHTKFRIGASLSILGLAAKSFWETISGRG